ncbi:DUF6186 family protein [Nocardia aurantiaca]|uniref:Uncharacterized protein n=1 Tax=Nocardia aurantiaca TaxID=2675850 RepID=A0A6I3L5Z8_9NOCA|nr:DUF6186 family protein [Nocardia aurantiaca]MTE16768.1 hypothetical protein [Nocardia aurantiaca]
MTDRALIIAGYAVLATVALVAELVSRYHRDRLTPLGETLRLLLSSRTLRVVAILVWAWLGWHFLAR